jgi:NADH:ubiquinone oxidoreductase subunit C
MWGSFFEILSQQAPNLFFSLVSKKTFPREVSLYTTSTLFFPLVCLLKKSSLFRVTQLTDICVVDYPSHAKRFELVYVLLSIPLRFRFLIHFFISENEFVPSMSMLFKNAVWVEREVWDMFGIFFYDHPDLRRILTDYGFDGFPFRKNFPLTGYFELRYDDEKMHIVYEPVELAQTYRYFNFLSPWEKLVI